jgi:hypothetical protein
MNILTFEVIPTSYFLLSYQNIGNMKDKNFQGFKGSILTRRVSHEISAKFAWLFIGLFRVKQLRANLMKLFPLSFCVPHHPLGGMEIVGLVVEVCMPGHPVHQT